MIRITLSEKNYEYDIHSLVKAFYPQEEIRICTEGETTKDVKDETETDGEMISLSVIFPKGDSFEEVSGQGDKVTVSMEDGPFEEEPVDGTDRGMIKNALKKALYRLLRKVQGRDLPWGNLTGIRPVRLVLGKLNEGASEEEIRSFMMDTYYVSKEKTELALEIAKRERQVMAPIHPENGYSLYVGIPFCPTTCLYCSFASNPIAAWKDRVDLYLDALEKELEESAKIMQGMIPDTVYIGGGTPTTLEPEQLDRLLTCIEKNFDLSEIRELTVESGRPDSITPEKLAMMKQHNVTRISINPQTFRDETLKLIGRRHTSQETIEAFKMARAAGFDNINMDLIMGLPSETLEDVEYTLSVVKDLSPESLTVHSLAVKRASSLRGWMEENGSDSICNTPAMMELCEEESRKMGLLPYYLYRQKNMAGNFENVGYAKEGFFGLYNILIMEEVQTIIACGAGTVTKRVYGDGRIERCDNVKDVALYISKIEEMIDRKRGLFK